MSKKPSAPSHAGELRRRAEAELKKQTARAVPARTGAEDARLLHELQVHQIELEMQNTELQEARDKVEALLETYTDLYDFAPVGYFSLDEQGVILEVNLTGAALLGLERSRLIKRRLLNFVDPPGRAVFTAFLKRIFADPGKQICEIPLLTGRGTPFWADLQAASAATFKDARRWCRVAISDLTSLKHEEEVRRRLEVMARANEELKREIIRRQKVEDALKKSEEHYAPLFEQSRQMQEQLRHLSRQLLVTQEEERKRISRELHDEIVQTLAGINVHLAALTIKAPINLKAFRERIARTRRLVEKSVSIVHRFARELRPTVLDDLGLIPALQSFIKDFVRRTKIEVRFTAHAGVERLDSAQRTALYRVAQSALANVDQHANATQVEVTILRLSRGIRLEIQDNGKSFKLERVSSGRRHRRLGLLGSRERVEMVGGKFAVECAPGRGTTIRAEIPLAGIAQVSSKTSRKSARLG